MTTISKYLVAACALVGGLYLIYSHSDARVAGLLIFFAGLLTDYAEVFGAAAGLVKQWRGQ